MEQKFTTLDAHPVDRFAYWREAVCKVYVPLDCETSDPHRFHGQIELKRWGSLATSYVKGSNQMVSRWPEGSVQRDGETFLVSLQLAKECYVEQNGRMAWLRPGHFALYSSTSHYRLTLPDDFSQLVLQFPRETLLARLPSADGLTAMAVMGQGGFGTLASEMLPRLVSALNTTAAQEQGQQAILDILVAAFAEMVPDRYQLHSNDHLALLRARAFIAKQLANPQLDRAMVAQEIGYSVRRLNEIFQKDGSSIMREIIKARQNRIAADLANRHLSRLSISELAYAAGVRNFQSFARGFRSRFGLTPSDYRSSALSMASVGIRP